MQNLSLFSWSKIFRFQNVFLHYSAPYLKIEVFLQKGNYESVSFAAFQYLMGQRSRGGNPCIKIIERVSENKYLNQMW